MKSFVFLMLLTPQLFASDAPPMASGRASPLLADQLVAQVNGKLSSDLKPRPSKNPLQICVLMSAGSKSNRSKEALNYFLNGAETFLKKAVDPQTDSACLVDFSSGSTSAQSWTHDAQALAAAVRKHADSNSESLLYDSVVATCRNFDDAPIHAPRRVLLVASDGEDRESRYRTSRSHLADAVTECHQRGVVIMTFDVANHSTVNYCQIITDPACHVRKGVRELPELAAKTGGLSFAPADDKATEEDFQTILNMIAAMNQAVFRDAPPSK